MNTEHALWTLALWVEKYHADAGPAHITREVTRLANAGNPAGVAMWLQVAERYDALVDAPPLPN